MRTCRLYCMQETQPIVIQHCTVVVFEGQNKRVRFLEDLRWWKLKENCGVKFRKEVRYVLGGSEVVLDNWAMSVNVVGELA